MDIIKTISNILGVICVIIGVLLIPLSIWFFQPAIKNKDKVSLITAIFVLTLVVGCLIGAFSLFTTGIIKQAIDSVPYVPK